MKEGDAYSPELLLEATQVLSRSLAKASTKTLQGAHTLIGTYFNSLVEASGGSFENAAEQRLAGTLWAEIEIALDERASTETEDWPAASF